MRNRRETQTPPEPADLLLRGSLRPCCYGYYQALMWLGGCPQFSAPALEAVQKPVLSLAGSTHHHQHRRAIFVPQCVLSEAPARAHRGGGHRGHDRALSDSDSEFKLL